MPQITISGDVNLIGWEGRRISVWEKYDAQGKEFSRLWTCWFTSSVADQLQERDFSEITGELSTKIGTYTTKDGIEKTVVEHHVQNAQIMQVVTKAQQDLNAGTVVPDLEKSAWGRSDIDEMPF
jgi:hypothetical protein